uniref:Protein CUSTOS n=1 Tax=Stegastes partitus TaxID=144197 RepID=A0A3B5AJ24_9TELE
MAAPAKKMVGASDSSSSDDEELRRCQEAVWETKTNRNKGESFSVIVVVADHEHDGNELQVTQGFRTHVAKKLGHFLDRCSSSCEASACSELKVLHPFLCLFFFQRIFVSFCTPVCDIVHLFSPHSDSDSEMEKRLKEAAVSVKDLLPSSMLPSTLSPQSTELPCSEKIKKKKKKKKVGSEQVDSAANAQSNGEHKNSEPEHTQAKVKRKKKKRREGNTEEALN